MRVLFDHAEPTPPRQRIGDEFRGDRAFMKGGQSAGKFVKGIVGVEAGTVDIDEIVGINGGALLQLPAAM